MPYTPAQPTESRAPLVPGLLGAVVALASLAVVGTAWFTGTRYVLAIVAAILIVFVVQARRPAWIVPLGAIVVVFNPVVPVPLPEPWTSLVLVAAAVVLVAVAVTVKTPIH